jgi:hypothetical protein
MYIRILGDTAQDIETSKGISGRYAFHKTLPVGQVKHTFVKHSCTSSVRSSKRLDDSIECIKHTKK